MDKECIGGEMEKNGWDEWIMRGDEIIEVEIEWVVILVEMQGNGASLEKGGIQLIEWIVESWSWGWKRVDSSFNSWETCERNSSWWNSYTKGRWHSKCITRRPDYDMWRSVQRKTNTTIIIYRFFYDSLFQYLRSTAVTSNIYKSEYLARFIEAIPNVDRGWVRYMVCYWENR